MEEYVEDLLGLGIAIRPHALNRLPIDARRRCQPRNAHVQMACELGLNPKKLGNLDNHRPERWKAPLPS